MKHFLILVVLISACFAIPAHADNIQNFYVDFQSIDIFTGYITIDTTTGIPLTGDVFIYLRYNNQLYEELNGDLTLRAYSPNNVFFDLTSNTNPYGGYLEFQLPTSSLVGYQGGPVCRGNGYLSGVGCDEAFGTYFRVDGDAGIDGRLVPTPEPSTLLLLSSGGLGLLGAARRRLKL